MKRFLNWLGSTFSRSDRRPRRRTFRTGSKPVLEVLESRVLPVGFLGFQQWANVSNQWINGQANPGKATFLEGDTVPYWVGFTGLTPGQKRKRGQARGQTPLLRGEPSSQPRSGAHLPSLPRGLPTPVQ